MDSSVLFAIRLSIQVAVASTILVTMCGVITAYFLASAKFKGKGLLEVLLTLPMIMPPTVTGYYLIIIFGRNGFLGKYLYELTGFSVMFNWYGAVLAAFVVSLPLMIRTTQTAFESVDKNYLDASYTLGYSKLVTAWKVLLPLSRRGIFAGIILSFARAIGEFGATLMVCGNIPGKTGTMPLTIYSFSMSGEADKANQLVLILTLVSAIFLYLANKFGKRGF